MNNTSQTSKPIPVGIDIGSSHTRIAVILNETIVPVPDLDGCCDIPTRVTISERRIYFGRQTEQPPRPGEEQKNLFDFLTVPDSKFTESEQYILQCFFQFLSNCIFSFTGTRPAACALSLPPALCASAGMRRIHQAAQSAGFRIDRVISCGPAMALGGGQRLDREAEYNLLAIHCGSRHLEACWVNADEGAFHVLLDSYYADSCGNSADLALSAIATSRLSTDQQSVLIKNAQMSSQMVTEAKRVKEALSFRNSVSFQYPAGLHTEPSEIFQDDLKTLLEPLCRKIMKIRDYVEQELEWRKMREESKNPEPLYVLLSGGMMHNPVLLETIRNCFPIQQFFLSVDSGLAAAGAAVQHVIATREVSNEVLLDTVKRDYWIQIRGFSLELIFPAGTTIPYTRIVSFSGADIDPDSLVIDVLSTDMMTPFDQQVWRTHLSLFAPPNLIHSKSELKIEMSIDSLSLLTIELFADQQLIAQKKQDLLFA